MSPLRTAVIGFGTAGRVFHAPFIDANPDYVLQAVLTRAEQRQAEVADRYLGTRVVSGVDTLLAGAAGLDLVVTGSLPATHAELADAFLDAGAAVVVDKPFVVTSAEGRALVAKAVRWPMPVDPRDSVTVIDLIERIHQR
jgi:scyllo-inositol 2-dehydrogenase (NADP+)